MKKTCSAHESSRQWGKRVIFALAAIAAIALLAAGCRRPADDDGAQTAAELLRVSSLTVQLNDGGNLIENFSSALRNWEIAISADDNKLGNTITIDAVPETGGEDVVFLPVDKTLALPIHEARTLAVCPESMPETAAYTVVIIPAQNDDPADHHSMNLSLHYAGGANLIQDFSASSQTYSINIDQGKPRELFIEARSMSSKSQVKITYDGSILEDYKAGGNADTSISADDLPKTGYKNIVVSVKSQAGTYMDYTIRLNAPEGKLKSYAGTIVYTGSATLDITGLAVRTTSGTDSQAAHLSSADPHKWTLDVGESWTPYSFVVEFQNATHVSYKSAVIIPAIQDAQNIVLTVGNVGIVIASVQDMQSVKNAPSLDYVLGQDLDLGEVTWGAGNYAISNFSGHFYGNGYTIDNLKFSSGSGNVGLFNTLGNNACIEDFTINAKTEGTPNLSSFYFGSVVGQINATGVVVRKVKAFVDFNFGSFASVWANIGGLIGGTLGGSASTVTIDKCASFYNIKIAHSSTSGPGSDSHSFGGLIAHGGGTITITDSYAVCNVDIQCNANVPLNVGGLMGQAWNSTWNIENSYTAGNIVVRSSGGAYSNRSIGGLTGGIYTGSVTMTAKNSAALLQKALNIQTGSPADTAYGRITGKYNTGTFTNNYALDTMLIGTTEAGTTITGAPTDKNALGKSAADFENPATWSALQFSESVWDFSTISEKARPELR